MIDSSSLSQKPSFSVVGENEIVHLFVRELTVLDYAYFDLDQGPLGGSLDVDVTFTGALDHEGVVFDFSLAKKAVKRVIDDLCDHRFVVPQHLTKTLADGRLEFFAPYGGNQFMRYTCPEQGLCLLNENQYSLSAMKAYLQNEIMKVMPPNVEKVELIFREEPLEGVPSYRYTHGLKQHYGNCQRLVHGHRNRLDVMVNGRVSLEMQKQGCALWDNIHLAFPENIGNADVRIGQRQEHLERVQLAYASSQGRFELDLPGHSVYVMPLETTVENIARHMRDRVQEWAGVDRQVQVFAYEGIRKGAHSSSKIESR